MNKTILIVIGLVVIVSVGLVTLITGQDEQPVTVPLTAAPVPAPPPPVLAPEAEPEPVQEEVAAPVAVAETPPTPEPPKPEIPLAEDLSVSDMVATLAVQKLSPELAQWIVPDEQVRKLVLVVDQLAAGKMPQRHIPVNYSMSPFKTEGRGDALRIDQVNEQRMDALVNSVVSMDPKQVGQYYQAWLPLLEEAYGELGKKDDFRSRVKTLVDRIQSIESAPEDPQLVRPSVLYQYADPDLEQRSDLEKWFWRMGDENREKVQEFLREIKFYL